MNYVAIESLRATTMSGVQVSIDLMLWNLHKETERGGSWSRKKRVRSASFKKHARMQKRKKN